MPSATRCVALYEALRCPEAQELNAVVIRSEGEMFCAGADLKEVANRDLRAVASSVDFWSAFRLSRPVLICAVQGLALGLGAGIAMSSDVVIASDKAAFGYPEIQHGLVASYMTVGLQQLMGTRKAFELVITGRRVPAEEALSLGMVTEVVAPEDVEARAYEMARTIADRMPLAIHTTKKFFYEAIEMPFTQGIRASERVVNTIRQNKEVQGRAAEFLDRGKSMSGDSS